MSAKSLLEMAKSAIGAAHLGVASDAQVFTTPLHEEGTYMWQVEHVRKEHEGEPYLADRLVKHDRATGEKETIGEYDTSYAAVDAVASLPNVPVEVRSQLKATFVPPRGEKSLGDLGIFRLPTAA